MEFVLGALPSLLPKLAELIAGEYNLQKGVKGGIIFLQAELESMKAALEDISKIPPDQLPSVDKIWATNVRELSYDIEDDIDTFMVQVKGHQQPDEKKHGFKKFVDRILGFSLRQPKIRRKIAIDIRDIKSRVVEVHDRHRRYEVNHSVNKTVKVDPLALVAMVRYKNPTELVGIEESRDEVIKILKEDGEGANEQKRIVSIVGFGGLGKTTLANAVYEKLRAQFDCSAFVSVSQTPNMDRLFKSMLSQLANMESTASIDVIIGELRTFLLDLNQEEENRKKKRYLVIVDDIWEISNWEMIRCALPDDVAESRIITTTRIFKVAEEIGGTYKMKHLSQKNSRILMYGRIFGKEDNDKCPDEQLEEVSKIILKKCDGVPLAIITIASLLASKGRNKLDWYDVCNSIGTGLEKNNSIENMRKVLSLSYNDMPSHLRTCLLYLSMFPEDYDIRKDRLIWLWIAEGFIQHEKQEMGLFEQGENYFNELVNRSLIQPTSMNDAYNHKEVQSCRVHDMVLDLICSLSSEENFVTIQNNMVQPSASKKVRRLSLQTGKAGRGTPEATLNKEHHVRSVIIFQSAIDEYIPTVLENFCILRVLDLEGCYRLQGCLQFLVNLVHLRYLCLRDTMINQLPEEIGNLQFLQMLDVCSWRKDLRLPSSIGRLKQLMCLHISHRTKVAKWIGSLIALKELSCTLHIDNEGKTLHIDNEGKTLHIDNEGKMLEELARLTELKVLDLVIDSRYLEFDHDVDKSLVECLNKLEKIQSLRITINIKMLCYLDGWVVPSPQNLRAVEVCCYSKYEQEMPNCWFATLPTWLKVNPTLLLSLSFLQIGVKRLQQEDLEILGRLPALRSLFLTVDNENLAINVRLVVCACSFPCLVQCKLSGFGLPVVFEQGAMPRLVDLVLEFELRRMREINGSYYDLGLRNLLSLQEVRVLFETIGASKEVEEEVKLVYAAVSHAIEAHPNHPILTGGVNNILLQSWTDDDEDAPIIS